ncbi:MAG: hypothetical protein U0797_19725 [Gemmataceae bacterium]
MLRRVVLVFLVAALLSGCGSEKDRNRNRDRDRPRGGESEKAILGPATRAS